MSYIPPQLRNRRYTKHWAMYRHNSRYKKYTKHCVMYRHNLDRIWIGYWMICRWISRSMLQFGYPRLTSIEWTFLRRQVHWSFVFLSLICWRNVVFQLRIFGNLQENVFCPPWRYIEDKVARKCQFYVWYISRVQFPKYVNWSIAWS